MNGVMHVFLCSSILLCLCLCLLSCNQLLFFALSDYPPFPRTHAPAQPRSPPSPLKSVTYDEAHLPIDWGSGFRPAYRTMARLLGKLDLKARMAGPRSPRARRYALSGSVNERMYPPFPSTFPLQASCHSHCIPELSIKKKVKLYERIAPSRPPHPRFSRAPLGGRGNQD